MFKKTIPIALLLLLLLIVPTTNATHINYMVDSDDDTTERGDGTTDADGVRPPFKALAYIMQL